EVSRRRPRLPDVLADRRPDQRLAETEQDEVTVGGEVAVLVEDAIVGEEALAIERLHLAVGADGAGVREVAVEPRDSDRAGDVGALGCDRLERRSRRADEARAKEQVLRRIARHRELREEGEIGLLLVRFGERRKDALAVDV